ncbi:hypothetical protein DFH28DRAFT_1217571 [Melampsora americana]|nr:hypothetical protein DFH28DRAFT_1217571 [Melampsora americana]
MSCTNALGLGQDWPSVMEVIVMGRMGLPELAQLFGRCGRGSSPGPAIHFVKENQPKGLNRVDEVNDYSLMSDDNLMDTFSFTPICLCVALSLGNIKDDQRVLAEQDQEIKAGFPKCKCSNCDPEGSRMLFGNLRRMTKSNYIQAMDDVFSVEGFLNLLELEEEFQKMNFTKEITKKKSSKKRNSPLDPALEELADELVYVFELHYKKIFGEDGYCESTNYFDLDCAKDIVSHLEDMTSEKEIKVVMGGDMLKGGVTVIFDYMEEWKGRDTGLNYTNKREKMIEQQKKNEEKRAEKVLTQADQNCAS